jgi:hypothetical protein
MRKDEAQKLFELHGGREGIAERVLEIAREIVETDSYKRAIAGAGQIALYAEISKKADDYWGEMVRRGEGPEMRVLYYAAPKFKLLADARIDFVELERRMEKV